MNREKIRIMICALLFLIVLPIIYAIPVPHGIDGNIYELDGITSVGNGIDFSVYDTTTGEFIQGKTRNNGRYSVSLNGNDGDLIIIKTWNRYHSSNRTIILQGVMHNADLLLNMSMPEFPPNITSEPTMEAVEDELYLYDVEAEDENNDILTYSLLVKPYGMSIDSENGIIEWMPNNGDAGYNDVTVQISDGIFVVNQSFIIEVINVNDAPIIISGPITSAIEDQEYEYDVEATDVDNEILYYYLDGKPGGMSINLTSGLIRWLPENDNVGNNNVIIRVGDGNLSTIHSFTINVINTNDEFIVNSTPVTTAIEDELYVYDVDAYDIDNEDVLVYALVISPIGMTIDSYTGLITWMPTGEQIENNRVIVEVTDGILYQNQSFVINVLGVNDPPNITSEPVTTAYAFRMYRYRVKTTDPENDALGYSLLEKPFNMRINKKTGMIRWLPLRRHIGDNTIIVDVSDGNLSTIQIFNISVYSWREFIRKSRGTGNIFLTQEIEKPSTIIEKIILRVKPKEGVNLEVIELSTRPYKIKKEDINLNVIELSTRPYKTKGLDKKVYKYLEIESEDEEFDSAVVKFKVEKEWLEENEAEIDDVILNRYIEGNWEEISTTHIESKSDYVYYEAEIEGFNYFAVSLKSIKEPTKVTITGPKEVHVISGIIFKNNRKIQVGAGTELRITNTNTGEISEGKTGFKQNSGGYYIIINCNDGDKVDIEVKNGIGYEKTSITLEGDMRDVDLVLTKDGLSAITGYAIAPLIPLSKKASIIMIAISLAICLVYIRYKREDLK